MNFQCTINFQPPCIRRYESKSSLHELPAINKLLLNICMDGGLDM